METKDKEIEELRSELQTEKVNLNSKLENMKQKFDQSTDDATKSKIDYER